MVRFNLKWTIALVMCLISLKLSAQDDDLLGDEPSVSLNNKVNFAFKTTKVINLQSLEMLGPGVFDFKMNHRFGAFTNGPINAFGLDLATIRFGGEYGINRNLMAGIGRSNVSGSKNVDGYLKYRVFQQTSDNKKPFSLLLFYGLENKIGPSYSDVNSSKRLTSVSQVIIGRKFNETFSAQFSPSYVMGYNSSNAAFNQVALGLGMRMKLTMRTTLNAEWIPILTNKGLVRNSASVGFDIETGGHVFQVHFTNSSGLNEAQFISNTNDTWDTYGIRFGFNLSRVFTIVSPSKFK
jgi:hypothetical protein